MCGLVGVAGDLTQKDNDVFEDLLRAGSVRGLHSTGAAFVSNNGTRATLTKALGPACNLLYTDEFHRENKSWTTNVLMGHNRHATIGALTIENAHPFKFSNIVGAHNGTLTYGARKRLIDEHKFGTDSEALFYNLNTFGPEDVMKEMSGAWALTWYDKRDNTINFLRNDQRPFHYTFNKTGEVVYWASEAGMLKWILDRHDVKYETVYSLKPDVLASFTVPDSKTRFGEPLITPVSGAPIVPFVPTSKGYMEIPWGNDEALEDWMKPKFLLAPPENSKEKPEDKPSSKKENGQKKKEPDVLPGLPSGKSLDDLTLQKIWCDGFVAGDQGQSKKHCPHLPGSEESVQWHQGRLSGLEAYRADQKKTPIEEIPRKVRGYNAEWIDEKEFEARTGGECRWGGCNVEFTDRVQWLGRNDCVCESCVTGNKLVRELLGKDAA